MLCKDEGKMRSTRTATTERLRHSVLMNANEFDVTVASERSLGNWCLDKEAGSFGDFGCKELLGLLPARF